MLKQIVLVVAILLVAGCSRQPEIGSIDGVISFQDAFAPLLGEWEFEEETALIINRVGDNLFIRNPPNDTWRIEISDVKAEGNTIRFVQRNFLISGEFSPFSGVACNCEISPVPSDANGLNFSLTTDQIPVAETAVYRRVK